MLCTIIDKPENNKFSDLHPQSHDTITQWRPPDRQFVAKDSENIHKLCVVKTKNFKNRPNKAEGTKKKAEVRWFTFWSQEEQFPESLYVPFGQAGKQDEFKYT